MRKGCSGDLPEGLVPIPAWWKSREEHVQAFIDNEVSKGKTGLLATSPGGRNIKMVSYGEPEPELRGTANYNSALGAKDPGAYYKRGPGFRKRPVLIISGGVHGDEIEGTMGAVSVLRIMESGVDVMGKGRPGLRAKLEKLRLIVIPLANPDGRARTAFDGSLGMPFDERGKLVYSVTADGKVQW